MSVPRTHPLSTGLTSRSALVSQLRSDRSRGTPVWFMRQAGRSLPEYRALRSNYGMLESCLTPEVAAEITLQPVRRHGVDAAVFFSDIVVPLLLAGIDVDIVAGWAGGGSADSVQQRCRRPSSTGLRRTCAHS